MRTLIDRRTVLAGAAYPLLGVDHASAAEEDCLRRLLDRRHMIRKYRKDPIPEHVLRRVLEAATHAPSAGHTQPWELVVVRDDATKRKLAHAALDQMFVAEAPVVVVPCANKSRSLARYPVRGERYALVDTAFASLLLLLAVTEEGLGACFVGAFQDREVIDILGLPGDVLPIAVVPIGHPAESPAPLPRRPLVDLLHAERW